MSVKTNNKCLTTQPFVCFRFIKSCQVHVDSVNVTELRYQTCILQHYKDMLVYVQNASPRAIALTHLIPQSLLTIIPHSNLSKNLCLIICFPFLNTDRLKEARN